MSTGTDFTTDIFLRNRIYRHKSELTQDIIDLALEIEEYKAKLKMLAISTPKDITTEEDILWYITTCVNETLEALEDAFRTRLLLLQFQDHLEETGADIIEYYPYKDDLFFKKMPSSDTSEGIPSGHGGC